MPKSKSKRTPAKKSASKKTAKPSPKTATKASGSATADVAKLLSQNDKKKVLHVGCGAPNPEKLHVQFRGPDWQEIRMDIDVNARPDIVADMTNMDMVEDNSFDAIFSSHNVEHLFPHQVPIALKEFFRVIKPEGSVLITLPDIQAVAEYVAKGYLETALYQSPAGPITALDIMYGHIASIARGNEYMAHKCGFTAHTLGGKLQQAGFSSIKVKRDHLDLWAAGHKFPQGHPAREDKITIFDPQRQGQADELDTPPTPVKPVAAKQRA